MDAQTNLPSSSVGTVTPETQIQDDQNDGNNNLRPIGRKRIRVACDKCRRKKIKCDGQYPCSNCLQSREARCHYTERPPKKKPTPLPKAKPPKKLTKKVSTAETLDMIDSRLSTLEEAIFRITDKLDFIVSPSDEKSNPQRSHKSRALRFSTSHDSFTSETSSESQDEGYSDEESTNDNRSETGAESDKSDVIVGMIKTENSNSESLSSTKRKDYVAFGSLASFVGGHSILGIFGKESLDYIEAILGPGSSNIITPLRNLPYIFWSQTASFVKKWVEPRVVDKANRRRLIEAPFPADSRIAYELVTLYYPILIQANTLVDQGRAMNMFTEYYNCLAETNPKKKRRFTISELFIMSAVLLISIACKIDMDSLRFVNNEEREAPPGLSEMSDSALVDFQHTLLRNCIYYYYTVSVVSEGLDTIEAILLLIIYIESNWLESTVNYIPVSTAVRFAQFMGLHRFESYEVDPEDEQRRRRIWWFCYYYDVETAFRTGKPPVINSSDVNIDIEDELLREFPDCVPVDYMPLQNSNVIEILNSKNPVLLSSYVMLGLAKVRAKSYNKLFTAVGQGQSFNTLASTIEDLNEEMYSVVSLFSEQDRPRFYNDPQFRLFLPAMPIHQKENLARVLVTYFLHLSIMNRLPLILQSPTIDYNDERVSKFRNISLDSARTVLVIIQQLRVEDTTITYFSSVLYFPLAAFTIIAASVLNHPTLPDAVNDIDLLIAFSMDFVKTTSVISEVPFESLCSKKDLAVGFAIILLLQIVIQRFESQTGSKIFSTNEQLQSHFKHAYSRFPDLFMSKQEFKSKIFSVFGSSPFGIGFSRQFSSASSTGSNTSQTYNQPTESPICNPSTTIHPLNRPGTTSRSNSNPTFETSAMNLPASIQPQASPGSKFSTADSNHDEAFDAFTDYLANDGAQNMYFNQMNNLPNFFFDNNLGI
ncbi:hypothetical protein JA1_001143 [Spathaspora sp. JA1]|nr:hypothetical protein JA1_001143 [Spathaspora sp. JA1]